MAAELENEAKNNKSFDPKSITFWRNLTGIIIILAFQKTNFYGDMQYFLGSWLAGVIIVGGISILITGFFYLFFTNRMKGRYYKSLVISGWLFTGLILVGQWSNNNYTRGFESIISKPIGERSNKTIESKAAEPALSSEVMLDASHPGWQKIVKTRRFSAWLSEQPDHVKLLASSEKIEDARLLLDKYEAHRMLMDDLMGK